MNEFIVPAPKPLRATIHTERAGRVDIEGSIMHGLETIFRLMNNSMDRDAALSRLRKLHYALNSSERQESKAVIEQSLRQAA